jgi:ribosome-associated translation inhibitor RaiA
MLKINLKNETKMLGSRELIQDRMNNIVSKFPELNSHKISITVSVYNSPNTAGLDEFGVKTNITGKIYNLTLEKRAANIGLALAQLVDGLLERINRYSDKKRTIQRAKKRKRSLEASQTLLH